MKTQESVLQPAALQVAIECLTQMGRQLLAGLGQVFDKRRIMPLDDLVEQCLFGLVALEPNTAHAQTARSPAACKTAGSQAASTLSVGQWLVIE